MKLIEITGKIEVFAFRNTVRAVCVSLWLFSICLGWIYCYRWFQFYRHRSSPGKHLHQSMVSSAGGVPTAPYSTCTKWGWKPVSKEMSLPMVSLTSWCIITPNTSDTGNLRFKSSCDVLCIQSRACRSFVSRFQRCAISWVLLIHGIPGAVFAVFNSNSQ